MRATTVYERTIREFFRTYMTIHKVRTEPAATTMGQHHVQTEVAMVVLTSPLGTSASAVALDANRICWCWIVGRSISMMSIDGA